MNQYLTPAIAAPWVLIPMDAGPLFNDGYDQYLAANTNLEMIGTFIV
ncbi:MAG TPA: hypothetical protein VF691_01430 [Cytophagaceae bacterium]